MKTEIIEKEYFEDLQEIKEIIKRNRNNAIVVVNTAMIISYYETGVVINKRKKQGNKYIERLANEFSYNEIFPQPGGQIPWRAIIEIMGKCHSHLKI